MCSPGSPSLNCDASKTCMQLSHYPSDTVDGSLGAFDTPRPLTAKTGPGASILRLIRDHTSRLPWATTSEFLGDFIGGICVCLIPFALLLLEFLK